MSLIEDLSKLKDKYPSDGRMIENKIKAVECAYMLLSIKDTEGMKTLVATLIENINSINARLLSGVRMDMVDRAADVAAREAFFWLITQFNAAEAALKSIQDYIKKYG